MLPCLDLINTSISYTIFLFKKFFDGCLPFGFYSLCVHVTKSELCQSSKYWILESRNWVPFESLEYIRDYVCISIFVLFHHINWITVLRIDVCKKSMSLNALEGTSLVAQWLRIRLPMQCTQDLSLVREDPTCRGATKPVWHKYWAWALEPTCHNYWSPRT